MGNRGLSPLPSLVGLPRDGHVVFDCVIDYDHSGMLPPGSFEPVIPFQLRHQV
jgi:hypothetical protein